MQRLTLFLMAILLAGCGPSGEVVDEFNTRPLKLPNGKVVRVEVMVKPEDMYRGMMFRESLAEGFSFTGARASIRTGCIT
jgi:hypothetical protein